MYLSVSLLLMLSGNHLLLGIRLSGLCLGDSGSRQLLADQDS